MQNAERIEWAARILAIQGDNGHARDVACFEVVDDAVSDTATLLPMPYPAQSAAIYELAEVAKTKDLARLQELLIGEEKRKELCRYRLALTDVEQINTMRLTRLAWMHAQCEKLATDYPHQATQYRAMAGVLETVAAHNWRCDRLSTAQGWAARKCFRMQLLPAVLREWSGS